MRNGGYSTVNCLIIACREIRYTVPGGGNFSGGKLPDRAQGK